MSNRSASDVVIPSEAKKVRPFSIHRRAVGIDRLIPSSWSHFYAVCGTFQHSSVTPQLSSGYPFVDSSVDTCRVHFQDCCLGENQQRRSKRSPSARCSPKSGGMTVRWCLETSRLLLPPNWSPALSHRWEFSNRGNSGRTGTSSAAEVLRLVCIGEDFR